MLVLAAPRPLEKQGAELEEDVLIVDCFPESNYAEILLTDSLIDPGPVVPLSALAARARHRDKVRTCTALLVLQTQSVSHKAYISRSLLIFYHCQVCANLVKTCYKNIKFSPQKGIFRIALWVVML